MLPETPRSSDDLRRELDDEKRARQRAVAEAERQGRLATAFDRLSAAVIANDEPAALLQELIELFVDCVRADVGVLRLREGNVLRSRSALGLEEEVASGFALPSDEDSAGNVAGAGVPVQVRSVAEDEKAWSDCMRQQGVRALYRLPLVKDVLVAEVLLGVMEDRELSPDDCHILGALGTQAAGTIVRCRAFETLRQGLRARDEVLAVVAHDLRNPLNVISLAAATALQRLPDSSIRRPIERIIRAGQRADRMVRDLLEIDAMETGRFSIASRRLEPAELILLALESQQSLAAEASIILATDLSPELPPIEADEERLLEVLENLIGNAIKFTSPSGSITVGASLQGQDIFLWVKDSGAGISAEEVPHIFDRFWQARKADRRGTGLGLTICKGIVEAHGGRIWAESAVGVGTTVFFTIPATRARSREAAIVPVASILLVDDRPENLLSLKAILDRPDYRLVTAASGEEALGLALRETFAVALIDIAMPGMNGLEVAYHLKELVRSRDIPIIFVTAFGDDPEEIHRAYSAGGVDYLVKPLDSEIVRRKVAVFVELGRKRTNELARLARTNRRG